MNKTSESQGAKPEYGTQSIHSRRSLFYHTTSKHWVIPRSGLPFYLLLRFPRRTASTYNLRPFHVCSTAEDEGLVQVKISEVVYMAYVHQKSPIPFCLFKMPSDLILKNRINENTEELLLIIIMNTVTCYSKSHKVCILLPSQLSEDIQWKQ